MKLAAKDVDPYIKIPEVGLGSPNSKRIGFNIQWQNKRLFLSGDKPLAVAVDILLMRLFENSGLLRWKSEKHLSDDIDLAVALLDDLRKGSPKKRKK